MSDSIQTVLIANRSEIAARIIRTCRTMGLETVAVYSDADRHAPFVRLADRSVRLGPADPDESYLNFDRIMAAAASSGADAIHPGYGFLAENPEFPARCRQEGVTFIGPSEDAIRKLGDKTQARGLAQESDVPVVPGRVLETQSEESAKEAAEEIGFPVLIKAAAGGGGKGMRVVEEPEAFPKAYREARGEAESAFGNPEVFVESYFSSPRHIEIQVLADQHGNAVHFGERECSVQRRHQKLIEEAPSTAVSEELRREMGEAALRLVQSAGYENAGTVEFLLDSEGNFYFLEVNTRLQVEHPVTEYITGYDLVREQLRVANGTELSYRTEDIPSRGWALECRICAEDPYSNFMPDSGTIRTWREPSGPYVRVDSGVRRGSHIGLQYDSLMAKFITYGEDRARAIRRMKEALKETVIVGPQTTIPLYLQILSDPDFCEGRLSTNYLDEFEMDSTHGDQVEEAAVLAAAIAHQAEKQFHVRDGDGSGGSDPSTSSWFYSGLHRRLNG